MARSAFSFWLLGLMFCVAAAPTSAAAQPSPAPLLHERGKDVIPGQYIVVFKDEGGIDERGRGELALRRSTEAQALVARLGGKVRFSYRAALSGFSARLTPQALKAVRAFAGVAYVEADQRVYPDTVQTNPPVGLDRTSERLIPLDHRYTYSESGAGVNVYVIDTGIRATHVDFGGRVTGGMDFGGDGHGTDDCYHHGTHVSGTIGGAAMGIAKQVALHPVRVFDCMAQGSSSQTIQGVDWVTANAVLPAVANMSLHGPASTSVDTAVSNGINAGITFVVSSANDGSDACTISPAEVPAAITVGSIDPTTDVLGSGSGVGSCIDVFAPGINILSDWNTSDTATSLDSGTSMATPHVSGVAARYLQNHPAATPAQVWAAIHASDDVTGTPGWGGIGALPAGSPNELLHWGSLNDGYNDGDPHLVTVDGAHFNFQGGGEYVYLRDNGLEIQTRETPVQTASSFLGADPYDGIASCVSLNTAVAAHVGAHRVTFEPGSGDTQAGSMVLRIDGVVVTLTSSGINLGGGAHVAPAPGGSGIEIDFADGTTLVVISSWWPSQNLPYLNVDVFHTAASAGLMGAVMPGSWLPALPNGTSVGAMPAAVHDRYAVLYHKFGDAWRVTSASSLFDYQPGQSTATFSYPTWPAESPPCKVPGRTTVPAKPIDLQVAVEICRPVQDKQANADCVFDVALTGEKGFADAYLVTQKLRSGATRTVVSDRLGGIAGRRAVLFTALVRRVGGASREAPTGAVQFMAGREKLGEPVRLDTYGRARFESGDLKLLDQDVVAHYLPAEGSALLSSSGVDEGKAMSVK